MFYYRVFGVFGLGGYRRGVGGLIYFDIFGFFFGVCCSYRFMIFSSFSEIFRC